jgi:glycosyltransferase involved in cell wall biosynthesis
MLTNAVSPDQLGGLQRYVRELAGAVSAKGVDVSVVARRVRAEDPLAETGADGVRLRRYDVASRDDALYFARYPLAALGSAWRAARAHAAAGGIVHVHFALPGLAPALGGLPYVQTFHAPAYKEIAAERQGRYALPAEAAAVRLLRGGERLLVRRATRIAVLSEFMRREVLTLHEAAAERVQSIPGGLDTDLFSPGPPVVDPFAAGDGPLLLTARRFVPRTGVVELVRAMPAVLEAVPDARLAVCGDGPLRPEVQAFIDGAGLGDRVRLLGRVSDDDLLGWYRRADLFVMPTQELEGFGLSAAEALATGTPVVGTPAGAVPELLAPLDARLVSAGVDSAALARTIVDVLAAPELLASVAHRARAHVHPGLSWAAVADRYLEFYGASR